MKRSKIIISVIVVVSCIALVATAEAVITDAERADSHDTEYIARAQR